MLKDYAKYLISEELLPNDIIIFCATVAPSDTTALDEPVLAKEAADELYEPSWFRLGVFRVKDFDSIDYCFRSISINSYSFFIAIPKLQSEYIKQKRDLLSKMAGSDFLGVRLTDCGSIKLYPPVMDAISSFQGQIINNPITYEVDRNAISTYLTKEQPNRMLYVISREDVKVGRTEDLEDFFMYLTFSREVALLCMQKVEFTVDGYNDDPRELYEIPEVVRYLGKLNKIFPYWLFYQLPEGKWLDLLLACLSGGAIERAEKNRNFVAMDTRLILRHIERWFISLNELSHKLSISERFNRKISEDFNERLKRFMPPD